MSKHKNLPGSAGRTAALTRKHRLPGAQSTLLSGLLAKFPCAPMPDSDVRSGTEAQVDSRSAATQTSGKSITKAES